MSQRKYLWIGLIAARANLAYFGEAVTRVIFLGIILYVFLCLWRVTYAETGAERLSGLSLRQLLWYLAITEAVVLSAPRVAPEVDQDVRTGALALQLIRPLSYPFYRLWTSTGERVVRFLLNAVVGSAIAWVFVGPLSLTPEGLIFLALALPLAFTLDFLSYFLIGLGAFWLEDTSGLTIIYSRLTLILGGTMIPIGLFPEAWQPILRWLPFASIVGGPARLFVDPDPALFGQLILRQGIAVLFFTLGVGVVYRAAIKRVQAHGG
ncbi:MAG TPA: ABC-2 family transporter protein [Blastocatellia bacterium]|nr:ABC-2 family transporter protein [Blastocatellia bacterium]